MSRAEFLRPVHPQGRSLAALVETFPFRLAATVGADAGSFVAATDFVLGQIPPSIQSVSSLEGVRLTGVTVDSRAVAPGDLFVALPGHNTHGARYTRRAVRAGAAAVLTDQEGIRIAQEGNARSADDVEQMGSAREEADLVGGAGRLPCVPLLATSDPRMILGEVAAWVYGTGDLDATLFGVTGTNGKTSVAYLLEAVLRQLGEATALSSTAERRVVRHSVLGTLTTPEASEVHALLARAGEEHVGAVVIEVSAQAVTQHRVEGIVFDVLGFTNLSRDHLDDYPDMDSYYLAKRELFQPEHTRSAVITIDDAWGLNLAEEVRAVGIPVVTLASPTSTTSCAVATAADSADTDLDGSHPDGTGGALHADWQLSHLSTSLDATRFTLTGPDGSITTSVPLPGAYMATNAALAIVMLVQSGRSLDTIAQVLEREGGVQVYIPGRTEMITGGCGPSVVVDYAHTPDGFARTLEGLRAGLVERDGRAATRGRPGRIIMVFGADGDRDRGKRAEMGAIAARGADAVIVTDYNPRYEDPEGIRRALLEGAREGDPTTPLEEIPDQGKALRRAIELAGEGDIVFYPGPGHETHQEVAGRRIPYSARDDARLALREAGYGS